MKLDVRSLPLAEGGFAVVICEAATGIVILPDGRRRIDASPYHATFTSLVKAHDYADECVTRHPEWECWILHANGKALRSVRAT
jgi:hypothetical protein